MITMRSIAQATAQGRPLSHTKDKYTTKSLSNSLKIIEQRVRAKAVDKVHVAHCRVAVVGKLFIKIFTYRPRCLLLEPIRQQVENIYKKKTQTEKRHQQNGRDESIFQNEKRLKKHTDVVLCKH